jgi:hypothetical protein
MSGTEIIAIAGVALAAVGTAATVAGAEQQASSQAQAAAYQAQVAANNQATANQMASQAVQRGEANATTQEMKTRATVGAITAAQAANNVDVNTGSALDVKTGAEETGQLDALTIRSNAAREAYGFKTEGVNFAADAGLLEQKSQQAIEAGDIAAAGSLLGGASSTVKMYQGYVNSGVAGGPGSGTGGLY